MVSVPVLGRLRRAGRSLRSSAGTGLWPAVDTDGPKVRLGLLWAAVSTMAVLAGPWTTSLVFGAVALGAAGQTCRSWRTRPERPYRPVAIGGALLCALAGAVGPIAVAAVAAGATVAALAAGQLRWGRRDWDVRLTVAIAVLVGCGGAAPAVIRDQLGAAAALAFVAWVHVIDASMFIVGSGASSRWEGVVAGAASAGAMGLAVAAVLVPPFRGSSPAVLALVAAVLVPAGTLVASMVVGRERAPVPALRRLDSYLVAGPAWALTARLLLDVG